MEDYIQQFVFHPFTGIIAGQLALLVLLMFVSASVSGSETAFFSLSPTDVSNLRKDPSKGAQTALKLLGIQDYLLATILIVNNLVNICAVIISNSLIDDIVTINNSAVEFVVKVIIVTFMLLLFGEIMPKIFATYNAYRLTKVMSVPLMFMKTLMKPFAWVLISSSSHINERMAVKKVNISMDELSNAIEITSDQTVTVEEKRILSGLVNFTTTEVDEIMRPRVDVVALDEETDFENVVKVVIDSGFSRIPIYKDQIDNVTGILYVKDLLPYLDSAPDFQWQKLCRQPYFVPEHKKINDLFSEFQNNQTHIAIVVDEYGSTLGIVSLEDILEEIVGEISDESDAHHTSYTKIDENTYIFEGRTHLIDFLKIIDFEDDYLDDVKGDAESLAGLMLEAKRDFLKVGDKLYFGKISLRVDSVDGRRIDKIKVKIDRED